MSPLLVGEGRKANDELSAPAAIEVHLARAPRFQHPTRAADTLVTRTAYFYGVDRPRNIEPRSQLSRYFFGTDGNMLIERRDSPRFDVALDIELSIGAGGKPIRGQTKDISESGLQLVLPNAVREGTVLDFRCPAFAGTAQAMWSRQDGTNVRIGLRFLALSDKDRNSLRETIANLRSALAGA